MSKIKSKGCKSTELKLRMSLVKSRLTGWVCNNHNVFGKPDFAFEKNKLAIFVDGCFWHGCKKCHRRPNTSTSYWDKKLLKNKKRDKFVNEKLASEGWKVIRIWEHDLENTHKVITKIRKATQIINENEKKYD